MSRRFVLLRHDCPTQFEKPSHWDFMLEAEGVLMTWELRRLPTSWSTALKLDSIDASPSVPATRLADHRLAYLDYEGPLSGERGSVHCVDRGKYELIEEQSERLVVKLEGSMLSGSVTLLQQGSSWEVS